MDIARLIDIIESALGARADLETTERLATAILTELRQGPPLQSADAASDLVVTATGPNRPGSLAALAGAIDSRGLAIRDISQTCTGDVFTLNMLVSSDSSTPTALQEELSAVGLQHNCTVTVQHKDLFERMHTV